MKSTAVQLNAVGDPERPQGRFAFSSSMKDTGCDPKTRDMETEAMCRDMACDPMFNEKSTDPKMKDQANDSWKRDGSMQTKTQGHEIKRDLSFIRNTEL